MSKDLEIEDITCRLTYGLNALEAIHAAMTESSMAPESYTDGLLGVWDYLTEQKERLVAL